MKSNGLGFAAMVGLALAAGTVSAQFGPPATRAANMLATPMTEGCAFERGWVAAEETTEGLMLRLARESLELCLARFDPPVLNRSADRFPEQCAPQRAWLAAEANTPGILQALALDAVMLCFEGEGATVEASGR
jgi:hypothetical protein